MAFRKQADDTQLAQSSEQRTTWLLSFVVALATASVAYTDWVVVSNISLGYLYVLPIALSALIHPLPVVLALVALCTFLQQIFGPSSDPPKVAILRSIISVLGFLIVGIFVRMIAKQRERLAAEIRHQRDEYERDLTLAAQVQRRVLPKPLDIPNLDLAALMQTARLLGGDYYDFFPVSSDTVDVVIADVSGKGAAASLLMPSLAVALRIHAHELSGPAAILKDLDEALRQITSPATFVTMFYARFNHTLRTLQYSSGGHNPPILLHTASGTSTLLEEAGPVLGILPFTEYTDTTLQLQPGDILTLFTDGVTEQENEAEEEFSLDRLQQLILDNKQQPAATLVKDVAEAVSAFAGTKEQSDDLTIVIAKIL